MEKMIPTSTLTYNILRAGKIKQNYSFTVRVGMVTCKAHRQDIIAI
jgi:hypothetical protein